MDVDDHEWELSKENVQPLRQGRHMSSLVAALHQDQNEDHNIRTQQNNFELELRSYNGDDPFSVWESYIKWTEQNHPKGSHDGQLLKLLERCLREFQADERYTNDPRFIHMWIKFACFTEDPVVVFTYMFDNGIGVNVASLYVEWAVSLERIGDSKRADSIYTEGLNRRAEPEDLLIQRHQQFQSRVARNITLQIAENHNPGMDMGENAEKRSTLGRLKASGPSHKVGVVRTGNIKLGSAGSLKDARAVLPKQLPSRGIPFFQDENAVSSLAPQQTNEWQSLPVRAVDNRENDKTPGVWTDAKVKQRPGTVPHVAPAPSFQILEDPGSAAQETPRKTTLINTQPLSSRKAHQTDVLSNVRKPPAGANNLKEVPTYQKDKIYNGLSEFSFEELRAIKYWRHKEEKAAEAEKLRKEEEQRENERRLHQKVFEMAEMLAQLQEQVRNLNVNRPANHAAQQQVYAAQQLELTHQIQEAQALMPGIVQHMEQVSATDENACIQRALQQPRQHDVDNSNTNSSSSSFVTPTSIMDTQAALSSDFITPTNTVAAMTCSSFIMPADAAAPLSNSLVTPVSASQARPGASTTDSLRTPIFNSASTYSLNSSSSSSFRRPHMQAFQTNTSSSNPSLESSSASAPCSSSSSSSTPVTMDSNSAVSSHPSTFMAASTGASNATLVDSNHPSAECSINSSSTELCTNTSGSFSLNKQRHANTKRSDKTGFGPKEPLSAPSPTVYTKEAMQHVLGMFRTSFMSDEQSTEEMAALHGATASDSKQMPFEICQDTTSTSKTGRQSLKSASVKKGLYNFYCDSDDGQENMLEPALPKSAVQPGFGASKGLHIYSDQPEENAARAVQNGLFIYHGEPDNKENGLEPALSSAAKPAFGSVKGLNIYCDQAEDNTARTSKKGLFIYRDEPEDKENGPKPPVLKSEAKPAFGASKGLDMYCDQPEDIVAGAGKKGLFIYHDGPEDQENGLKSATQKPERKPAFGGSKGLNIYCDQRADKENWAKDTGMGKSVKRDLGFSINDDVEMTDMDREGHAIDFTIECGARNEMTIAGLDSFNLQAKYASTPCVSGFITSRPPTQDLADATSTCSSSAYTTSVNAPTPNKYLSPISEGSGEGCPEESKSYQQSLAASKVFPNASSHTRHASILKEEIQEPMEAETEADRDVSMNDDVHADLDKSCGHHVDTTTYIPQTLHEKTQSGTGFDPKDPFDDAVIAEILHSLKPPITEHPNFMACSDQMPDILQESMMCLGEVYIGLEECIGEGGYAKIYRVTVNDLSAEDTLSMDSGITPSKVIKVQTPPCCWEFYVSSELRRRLTTLKTQMNVIPSIMEIEKGYFFEDGSVLQMAHAPHGSLLNLVNKYKNDKSLLAGVEPFACLLTIELLHMFEQIHACGFIHGDVKPDNFLFLEMPKIKAGCTKPQEVFGSQVRLVQLIDFGQSIDLTKFARGTTFLAKIATSGFQCIEMRTNRPWTFQTDLFGLVGTIHVVLFGSYMNVFEERGVWRVTGNFMRKWNAPLWKQLFKELLNIPSCDEQPDLASLRADFETYFVNNLIPAYNLWVHEIKDLDIDC